jgi:hypothetical protein
MTFVSGTERQTSLARNGGLTWGKAPFIVGN